MSVTTNCDETNMVPFHKGLSEWWSEETEYVFQRIERWAAFARGYNRLRSERLSKGRLTMHEEHDSRWSISSNKLIIEDPSWNPSFHKLKRSRRRSRQDEETKINNYRQSVLGYSSNDHLDSTCLENYRYDHSIYFKTIGEIRNGKKNLTEINDNYDDNDDNDDDDDDDDGLKENVSFDYEDDEIDVEEVKEEPEEIEEGIEDDQTLVYDSIDDQYYFDNDETRNEYVESNDNNVGIWPIVDLSKLDLNSKMSDELVECKSHEVEWTNNNNNYMEIIKDNKDDRKDYSSGRFDYEIKDEFKKDQDDTKGIFTFKMIKHRPTRMIKRSTVCGDNNVIWPGILLNYTRNVDITSSASPHHHYSNNFK
ncbi:hypothetical protein M0802_005895 [Mischocyttarus mexicanus]|nr:hypothetical protein M0802_005895 [Mischocyttarus mexicanus]